MCLNQPPTDPNLPTAKQKHKNLKQVVLDETVCLCLIGPTTKKYPNFKRATIDFPAVPIKIEEQHLSAYDQQKFHPLKKI